MSDCVNRWCRGSEFPHLPQALASGDSVFGEINHNPSVLRWRRTDSNNIDLVDMAWDEKLENLRKKLKHDQDPYLIGNTMSATMLVQTHSVICILMSIRHDTAWLSPGVVKRGAFI